MKNREIKELNLKSNYVKFKDEPRKKYPIEKGSGFIKMEGNKFSFGYRLLKSKNTKKGGGDSG